MRYCVSDGDIDERIWQQAVFPPEHRADAAPGGHQLRAVGRVYIVSSFSRPEVYTERRSSVGIRKSGPLVRVIVNVGFFHLLYSLLTGKRITGQEIVAVIVIFHLLPEQKRSEVSYLRFTGIDISALIGYKLCQLGRR